MTHDHLQLLLSTGLIMRHSSGSFLFGIPGAGAVIKAVTAARKVRTRRTYHVLHAFITGLCLCLQLECTVCFVNA